ncbi:MAG: LacI family DNA-binding transcriptional regulator [Prolixibacteraceae bacterium]
MAGRITIKDIAIALNMHHSTVSRALRNDKRVHEKTRKLVLAYAEENGYQVNMSALQLRGSLRNVIAVIVPNINHNFFSNIISLVTNLAEERGYIVSIFQSNESTVREKKIIDTVIQNNVAGVIASVAMNTTSSDHFKKLKNFHIPLVLFDRTSADIKVPKVEVNNAEIISNAVELLYQKGCRKISHISGPQHVSVFKNRHQGYLNALTKLGLTFNRSVFIENGFTTNDGRLAVDELFTLENGPDGLICDSNILLIGILLALKSKKINIPLEVRIVAFSDQPFIEAFSPGLICIHQPEELVAQSSFNLLMKSIENEDADTNDNIVVSANIIEPKNNE